MFNYPVYKAIKERIKTVAPVFFYLGQYQKGKDNTSYRVPAIYIEMPHNNSLVFFGKKLLTAKNALVKIHFISNAPFKNHDNTVQDSALAEHNRQLKEINDVLQGWNVSNSDGTLLTQQLLPTGSEEMKFLGNHVASIISYSTELYRKT